MLRLLVFLLCCFSGVCQADFKLEPYQTIVASNSELPGELLYPECFRRTDKITLVNLIGEFRSRFEFFVGLGGEPAFRSCFKMQARINKGLERMLSSEGRLPFNYIDDALIYNPSSPFFEYLRPVPLKTTDYCSFRSFGDLVASGTVYCVFHGSDFSSRFYLEHQRQFDAARPAFTAFDLAELLIFLPTLLIIPVIWLILKKALVNK